MKMTEVVFQDTPAPSDADANKPHFPFSSPEKPEEDPSARFRGPGSSFRAKLIGSEEVTDSRGDKMCQDSLLKLKALVKASGQHKQKIVINITLDGIKLIDLMTAQVIQQHSVQKISFIARDQTDRRAFGYVYGLGDGKHQFFGIKTAKVAEQVVLSLRDLFQVVYKMKKKEIEEAKSKENNGTSSNPAQTTTSTEQSQKQPGNILALQEQLETMHQMSDLAAFKSEMNDNIPTSPDTPGSPAGMNLFGTNGTSTANADSSYSGDLAGFDMEALEPAADGGAKLTKNEILAGFSQGISSPTYQPSANYGFSGNFMQQQPMQQSMQQPMQQFMQQPMQQPPPFFANQQQPAAFGAAPQPGFGAPQQPAFGNANPFGGGQSMGMFPPSQRPAVPARTGAMRPPAVNPAQTGAVQNPFGDAFGGASSGSDSLLAPINSQPKLASESSGTEKAADPFASLIPGMGSGASDKKDMFKNFQMAKPAEKSNTTVSSNFDDYFMKSVGGVPLDTENSKGPTPTPAPRSVDTNPASQMTQNNDPFAAFGGGFTTTAPQQPDNNVQSLFG